MPLIVTFSGGVGGVPGLALHGLTPSATFTSRYFCNRFVPAAKGRYNRPPVSDWLTTVDPGGYLKLNPYLAFAYTFQPVVSVPAGVGVRVGVEVAAGGVLVAVA